MPTGNYQPVILAEFVGCILLTALSPIATAKEKQGLSPYAAADMVKLASITLLFLLLSFISVAGQGPARIAAWLGGLVLIADGLFEGTNIAKDIGLLTGGLDQLANPATSSTTTSPGGGNQVPGRGITPITQPEL